MRTAHRIGSVLISLICATACNLPEGVVEPDGSQAGTAGADADGEPGSGTGGTGAVDPGANGGDDGNGDGDDDDEAKGGKVATGGKGNSEPGEPDEPAGPGDDEEPAEPEPGAPNPAAVLEQASRGSAVALSSDESIAVIVNRDVGSLSVLELDASGAGRPAIVSTKELDLGKTSEPWQVVIAPDGDTAFVVLRREQKIVRVRYLSSEPEVDGGCDVGSEPTSIALTPTGKYAYVTNWNDGNLSVFDTSTLEKLPDIDLNPALVATGYLGEVAPRAALAHPRSITISNDFDDSDEDESLYVTEYFGQQVEAEAADGSNSDTRNVGILYKVALADGAVKTIELAPLSDMGFKDANNQAAGCYPNQVQSIALNGPYAYVVSVCASPKGPLGGKVTTTNCTVVDDCAGLNLVDPA
jgi:YVTN family beta-propeller protein